LPLSATHISSLTEKFKGLAKISWDSVSMKVFLPDFFKRRGRAGWSRGVGVLGKLPRDEQKKVNTDEDLRTFQKINLFALDP
jgi:hypothetical protein